MIEIDYRKAYGGLSGGSGCLGSLGDDEGVMSGDIR